MGHGIEVPIILQIIDTPFGKLPYIFSVIRAASEFFGISDKLWNGLTAIVRYVGRSASETGVRNLPGRRVNAHLQAQRMHIIAKGFHVWKSVIGLKCAAARAARSLPSVIDVDVSPPVGRKATLDQVPSGRANLRIVDVFAPAIPAVPTHRRRKGDAIADHDLHLLVGHPSGAVQPYADLAGTCLNRAASNLVYRRVKFQAGWQILHRPMHRRNAGGVQSDRDRRAGPAPVDARAP